jgi:hypothetical protein
MPPRPPPAPFSARAWRPLRAAIDTASRLNSAVPDTPSTGGIGRSQCTVAPEASARPEREDTRTESRVSGSSASMRHAPARASPAVTFPVSHRRTLGARFSGQ